MAKKPTLSTIASGYASNTTLNSNFEELRDAFDNTLSLDGSTPNAMGADLDLNGNNIIGASGLTVNGTDYLAEVTAAKAAALVAQAAAETAETNAELAETNAGSSQTAAASSASAASSSATAAQTAETAAELAETNAETAAALATTNGAAQVVLATDQVALATTQANLATTNGAAQVALATTQAGLATTNGAAQVALATTQAGLATTNGAAQVALATTQATNAANSATTANAQAVIATTKASEASASATQAAADVASIAGAAGAAVDAANSAAAAAAALDNFDDRYLGPKSSEPTVDNDGDALVSGALYFSTISNAMQVYDGANWIAASAAGVSSLNLYEYTATAGQTTFTGSDDNGNSISYIQGNEIVVLNGIILDPSDYNSTSGTSIVLGVGAAVSDLLNVYAFKSFTVADTVAASTGGTFGGNVTVTGTLAATTLTGDGSALTGLPAGYTDTDVATYLAGVGNVVVGGTVDGVDIAARDAILTSTTTTANAAMPKAGGTFTGTIDVTGAVTADGLTVAGNVSVDGGTIKLDGNYPVGTGNVALGDTALDSIASGGTRNTAIGFAAGTALTTQDYNVFVGSYSGDGATGSSNVAVGDVTLRNASGSFNTAIGGEALTSSTTASDNTAVGYQALYANTTASGSVAVGRASAASNTTGVNTSVGDYSLNSNTTGSNNTALGKQALQLNTTASNNTAVGYQAGYSQTTADSFGSNTFIGQYAGYSTTGSRNSFLGAGAGNAITSGARNTIIGRYNGNENGLDIRTSSNNIVLSDGDGNPRLTINSSGVISGDGSGLTGVGASTAVGAVGTYYVGGCAGTVNSGATVAGSDIWDQGLSTSAVREPFMGSYGYNSNGTQTQSSLSGTWRLMSGQIKNHAGVLTGSLFVRIS